LLLKIIKYINPLASSSAGASALKYGDVNTVTPYLARSKGYLGIGDYDYLKNKHIFLL